MTLLEFLNAYADRHGNVVIKDEYNIPIVSGDSWNFVVEQAEYMKYEELHARKVYCFFFVDDTLHVCLDE